MHVILTSKMGISKEHGIGSNVGPITFFYRTFKHLYSIVDMLNALTRPDLLNNQPVATTLSGRRHQKHIKIKKVSVLYFYAQITYF